MKTANYKRLAMTISLTNARGRYEIAATINGREITATTDDAEIYGYFDCDYYDLKDKNWARRAAYNLLKQQ